MVGIATMARFAIVSDVHVSKVWCILECAAIDVTGRVTDRTILSCRQVANCLTGGDITVMTRHAVIRDAHMIKRCRYKTRGYVAGIAFLINGIGRNVINELARSDLIIVAGRADVNGNRNEVVIITTSSETAG